MFHLFKDLEKADIIKYKPKGKIMIIKKNTENRKRIKINEIKS